MIHPGVGQRQGGPQAGFYAAVTPAAVVDLRDPVRLDGVTLLRGIENGIVLEMREGVPREADIRRVRAPQKFAVAQPVDRQEDDHAQQEDDDGEADDYHRQRRGVVDLVVGDGDFDLLLVEVLVVGVRGGRGRGFGFGREVPVGHHRVEADLADEDPLGGEVQLDLDEFPDTVVQLDGDVPRVLEDLVLDVFVRDGLALVVPLAAYAEHDPGVGEDLHVLREQVVAVDVHGGKLAHSVELHLDFDGLVRSGVVLPAHPRLGAVEVDLEVVVAVLSVDQLAQTVFQFVPVPVAVVGEIVELPVGPALVTLRHGVADDAFRPATPVQFHPHADGSLVVAVGVEPYLARPYWWFQFVFGLQIRVDVCLYYLENKTANY